MIRKNYIYVAIFLLTIALPACKKKSTIAPATTTTTTTPTSSGSVLYTVQVLSANGLATHRTTAGHDGLAGAVVTTNENGILKTDTTDASGLATFSLDSGVITVTISAPNFTTLNYLAQIGTDRYNSTMAILFPLSGQGTSTITGNVYATLDQTSTSTVQLAPDGIGINAYIDVSGTTSYVNVTSGQGTILKVAYQSAAFRTTVAGGAFSLTVPALVNGLPIILQGDDFSYNVKVTSTTFTRKVFAGPSYSLVCKSGRINVHDIQY